MAHYYQDETITLHHGDSLDVLRTLPDQSVDCCVTSPPYFGLRDYGVDGQIGSEKSPAEYVEKMRSVFAEVRRVLADDGTFWLNLGDSYSSKSKGSGGTGKSGLLRDGRSDVAQAMGALRAQERQSMPIRHLEPDVPDKNLLGIPWRVAFALQDDGWILRNAIIWAKPNAMPESVTDRLSTRYEMVFLFAKSKRYAFDLDAVRELSVTADRPLSIRGPQPDPGQWAAGSGAGNRHRHSGPEGVGRHALGKNPGDVWTIPTAPFGGAHFAAYPPDLVERCILSGCKPGGTVLDPFSGSGTTGMVALKHGRKYVGIDLSAEYLDLSLRTRLHTGVLDFGSAS